MTIRQFYERVIRANIDEDTTAYAALALQKLDKDNAIRRERIAAKETEKEPMRELLFSCLTAQPKTAAVLIAETGLEIHAQKVAALLKPYLERGEVVKSDVTITGKKPQKAYALA